MNSLKQMATVGLLGLSMAFSSGANANNGVDTLTPDQISLVSKVMQQVVKQEVQSSNQSYAQCVDENFLFKPIHLKQGDPPKFDDFNNAIIDLFDYLRDVRHAPLDANTPPELLTKWTIALTKGYLDKQCNRKKSK